MRRRNIVLLIAAAGFASGSAGCGAVIFPPDRPADPVDVYVINYGHHTGLALPVGGAMTEYTYGEKNWFALNQNGPLDFLSVLILQRPGSLARQTHAPAASADEFRNRSGAAAVLAVPVERSSASALAAKLHQRYESRIDTAQLNSQTGLMHVDDPHPYNLLAHNCNHELAGWLRDLGCRVQGPAVTSNFSVARSPERETSLARGAK